MDSNDELQKIYKSLNTKVVDTINANDVIDFLFAADVLSNADYHLLTDISERMKKTRKLLALLHSGNHPEAFIKLHEAIKKQAAYGWLAKQVDDLRTSSKGAASNASTDVEQGEVLLPFVKILILASFVQKLLYFL
jgi:hypothetical protein